MNKKTPLLLAFVFLLSTLALISGFRITTANPKTITVGPTAEYPTIQEAINNADAGDSIIVQRGTYIENVIVNKTVFLIGEERDSTIVDANSTDNAFAIFAGGATVSNFTARNSGPSIFNAGIYVFSSASNSIINNRLTGNSDGIALYSSNNVTLANNVFSLNANDGISLHSSSNCTVASNSITGSDNAIALYQADNNTVKKNSIVSNSNGIILYTSDGNVFSTNNIYLSRQAGMRFNFQCFDNVIYHNNLLNNTLNAFADSENSWDHVGEGNFWGDYGGHDIDADGIGDVPYDITAINKDNFPLMGQFYLFRITFGTSVYETHIISNSTVSALTFEVSPETDNRILKFNATGPQSASEFSRAAIPAELMPGPYFVLLDGQQLFPKTLNGSSQLHSYLYFTYTGGSDVITIVSSETLRLYNELLAKYDSLRADFEALNQSYYSIVSNYTMLQGNFSQLQLTLIDLNSSLQSLESLTVAYNNLLANYIQLVNNFTQLQNSLQGFSSDNSLQEQNLRSLIYILATVTAVFVGMTVYLSKRAHSGFKTVLKSSEEGIRVRNSRCVKVSLAWALRVRVPCGMPRY